MSNSKKQTELSSLEMKLLLEWKRLFVAVVLERSQDGCERYEEIVLQKSLEGFASWEERAQSQIDIGRLIQDFTTELLARNAGPIEFVVEKCGINGCEGDVKIARFLVPGTKTPRTVCGCKVCGIPRMPNAIKFRIALDNYLRGTDL